MIYSIGERKVHINGKEYFIAESADIIGSVTIENNVSIWFNTVVRGDIGTIEIGEGTNIQDGSILHTDMNGRLTIGKGVSVGHMVVLHNCEIGNNTLIGMNAVVLSGSKVGNNCIIGANTLITGKQVIPDNSMVVGSPGRIVRVLKEAEIEDIRNLAINYIANFMTYSKGLKIEKIDNLLLFPNHE